MKSLSLVLWIQFVCFSCVCCCTLLLHRDSFTMLFVTTVVDHDIFYRVDVWYFLPNSRLNLPEVCFVWCGCCFWIVLLSSDYLFSDSNSLAVLGELVWFLQGLSPASPSFCPANHLHVHHCYKLPKLPYLLSLSFHYTKSHRNHWAGSASSVVFLFFIKV